MKRLIRVIGGAALLIPVALFAAEVSVENETTLRLPSDDSAYTLAAFSTFTSLTVNSTSFDFVMSAGHRVTLRSGARTKLTNTLSKATECGVNESSVTLELESGAASQTVTITPSGTCTSTGSGGVVSGGGGGGGSSSSGSTASTQLSSASQSSADTLADLQQKLNDLLKQVPSAASSAITRNLVRGSTGDEVIALQTILALDSAVYPQGIINGAFGPLTQAAVGKFQEKHGIAQPGEPGYGTVGPKTRAKLNELGGQGTSASSAASSISSPATPVSGGAFTKSLFAGMRSDDVSTLQTILAKDSDVYPKGLVTGYFGPLTQAAVGKFQEKHDIAQPGEPGYGTVGPKTRAKLNELTAQ